MTTMKGRERTTPDSESRNRANSANKKKIRIGSYLEYKNSPESAASNHGLAAGFIPGFMPLLFIEFI
jgi:hypothetical protein